MAQELNECLKAAPAGVLVIDWGLLRCPGFAGGLNTSIEEGEESDENLEDVAPGRKKGEAGSAQEDDAEDRGPLLDKGGVSGVSGVTLPVFAVGGR